MCFASLLGCFGIQKSGGADERSILRHVERLFDSAGSIDSHGYYIMAGKRVGTDRTGATAGEVRRILLQALRSQERKEVLDSMKVLTAEPVALHAGAITIYFKGKRPDERVAKLEIYDWGTLSITGYDKSIRVWQLRGEATEFMDLFEELSRQR
jgi:hypothetical protein